MNFIKGQVIEELALLFLFCFVLFLLSRFVVIVVLKVSWWKEKDSFMKVEVTHARRPS
jgi:hypothetical protein